MGCAAPEQPPMDDEDVPQAEPSAEPEPEAKVAEKTVQEPPAPTTITEPEAPKTDLSPALQTLINKADEKIKNIAGKSGGYQFLHAPPPDNLARDEWFIKGNKITIKMYEQNVIEQTINYDTVYIDTETKTVVAYCEDERSPRCPDSSVEFSVNYDDVMIKTPYQWLKEIKGGEITGSEMLWDRKMEVVSYTVGGINYKQWVDGFAGIPVKVLVDEPGEDPVYYEFRELAINSVTDDILEH